MAHQLKAQHERVALLVMVQSTPHGYPRNRPGVTRLQSAGYRVTRRIQMEIDLLAEAKASTRVAHLVERGRRFATVVQTRLKKQLTPLLAKLNINLPPSQASHFEELGDRHMYLWHQHQTKPYCGKVTLLRAEKQPLGILPDPTLGWAEFIEGDLEVHMVPGHRLGMLSEPRVQIVASQLKEALAKADRAVSVLPHE
jgi:thioesterase domain-containing protein